MGETQIVDLHIWSIGAGIFAAELVVLSDEPQGPGYYKDRIPSKLGIVHSICEVHQNFTVGRTGTFDRQHYAMIV